jgi:HPt (histidine-containing phosphotransfer) domain-containing protein
MHMAMAREDNVVQVSESTKARYLKNLGAQLQLLRNAMEKSENDAVREICHRVRGSASLFGLKELGDACRDVEEACMAKNNEAIVSGFQAIEVILNRHLGSASAEAV